MTIPIGLLCTDRVKPSVSVTNPTGTVSGTITFSASASDNDKVASVELQVDGAHVTTITTAPYQASYDTRSLSDGSHAFKAIATDRIGNTNSATANESTSNNISAVYGSGNGTISIPSTPANSRIIVGIFVWNGTLDFTADNLGNGYSIIDGPFANSDHGGANNLYLCEAFSTSAGVTSIEVSGSDAGGGGPGNAQTTVVAAAYARANTLHQNSGFSDWGPYTGWSGPGWSAASPREAAVAITYAEYDDGTPGSGVSVGGGFTKRCDTTAHDTSDGELALSDLITSSGGSATPSGTSDLRRDVFGCVASFEGA